MPFDSRPESVAGTEPGDADRNDEEPLVAMNIGGGAVGDGLHEDGGPKPTDAARKKKRANPKPPAAVRTWLRIEPTGESNVLQADKYKLTSKLGIQTRDLRLLDPHFTTTYPSCILCREKSIVVNLEHIKAIITTKFMLVVNPDEDTSVKFIAQLKRRLGSPGQGGGGGLGKSASIPGNMQDLQKAAMDLHDMDLPFELRALEICLDELASEFDTATSELEAAAYPALDSLATQVTSPRLERVRRIKNRLVRLTTRVETVREVLEKFLDDDDDMHDLNLTANEAREMAEMAPHVSVGASLARISRATSHSAASTNSSLVESETAEVEMLLEAYFLHYDNTYNRLETLNEYIKDTEDLVNIKLDQHRNQAQYTAGIHATHAVGLLSARAFQRTAPRPLPLSVVFSGKWEIRLGAVYGPQGNHCWLLITTDLILTAFTCAMAIVTTISGIFGMNLDSGLQVVPGVFNQVTIITCVGSVALFGGFVVFAWRRGLLSWS
ncbi:hypothetical protein FOA52_009200 [Chlamydomonas sp. UWO 241]|nr:hypothetical protein FOA52_009200 [Chlamydomonas sp. UWO 241]